MDGTITGSKLLHSMEIESIALSKTKHPLSQTCSGVPGVPSVPGLIGRDGAKGEQGPAGAHGKKGLPGPMGPSGKTGAKGDKGEKAAPGVVPERNWKQCAWKKLNDDRDFGLIKRICKNEILFLDPLACGSVHNPTLDVFRQSFDSASKPHVLWSTRGPRCSRSQWKRWG